MFLDEKKLKITLPEGLTKNEVKIEDNNIIFTATPEQDGEFEIEVTYNNGEPIKIPLKVLTSIFKNAELSTEQTEFHLEDEIVLLVKFSKKIPSLDELIVSCTTSEAIQQKGEKETSENLEGDEFIVTYKYTAKQLGEGLEFKINYKSEEVATVQFSITAEPTLQQGSATPNEIENDDTSEIKIPFSA